MKYGIEIAHLPFFDLWYIYGSSKERQAYTLSKLEWIEAQWLPWERADQLMKELGW